MDLSPEKVRWINMIKGKKPLFSDEFLEELAEEINDQYGPAPSTERNEEPKGESPARTNF